MTIDEEARLDAETERDIQRFWDDPKTPERMRRLETELLTEFGPPEKVIREEEEERQRAEALARMTGVEEEQADWEADEDDE